MIDFLLILSMTETITLDNEVRGTNMGSIWVLSAPGGPHVGPIKKLAIRAVLQRSWDR